MRAKSLVLIMIALACGLVASIGISQVMEQGDGEQAPEMKEIFVAMSHVDIGDALDSTNMKLEEWPEDRIPEGSIDDLGDIEGRFARQRLYPGEPILHAKLMDSNTGDNASKIPEGYRVCSIKVTLDTSVSNLIIPGDRVDLVAFFKKSADIPITGTRTILRNVRVFAINAETDRDVEAESDVITAKTVSVLVKPQQVELVMLAGQLGKLSLSLRRPGEEDENDVIAGETTINELLNARGEFADDRPSPGAPGIADGPGGGLLEFLKGNEDQLAADEAPPEHLVHTMTVFSPGGATRYEWSKENQMPAAVPMGGAGSESPFAPTPTANETLPGFDDNPDGSDVELDAADNESSDSQS